MVNPRFKMGDVVFYPLTKQQVRIVEAKQVDGGWIYSVKTNDDSEYSFWLTEYELQRIG